jgi:hypothetical protein
MAGKEIWATAVEPTGAMVQPDFVARYCFYSLTTMLGQAEDAAVGGHSRQAIEKLRELQAHCEKMIGVLAPEHKGCPKIVAA